MRNEHGGIKHTSVRTSERTRHGLQRLMSFFPQSWSAMAMAQAQSPLRPQAQKARQGAQGLFLDRDHPITQVRQAPTHACVSWPHPGHSSGRLGRPFRKSRPQREDVHIRIKSIGFPSFWPIFEAGSCNDFQVLVCLFVCLFTDSGSLGSVALLRAEPALPRGT